MKLRSRPSIGKVALMVATAVLIAWIGWATVIKFQQAVNPAPPPPAPPVSVQVEVVSPAAFAVDRSWRGSIEVDERAVLSAQLTATVLDLPFREGERVKAGEIIYRLDDAEMRAELGRLNAVVERIGGELETARREQERQRELFESKLTPEKLLDDAVQRVDSLSAQLREAQASRSLVQTRLEYAVGTAPFGATVQRLHVQRGELARAGSPVLELVAADTLKAVVQVAQGDIGSIRAGQPASVYVPALEQRWDGQVDRIYPALDEATRNATIAVLLPESAAGLRVGMAAVVDARLALYEAALTLPAQAVYSEHGASWVFVADGDRARRRAVRVGPGQGGRILIEEGLEDGSVVIVTADPRVHDGAHIRVEADEREP